MAHDCHALNCGTPVPPRMHMCKPPWRMVPRRLQSALWAAYVPGQERRMSPSVEYLHAAAACVRSVAEQEGRWECEDEGRAVDCSCIHHPRARLGRRVNLT